MNDKSTELTPQEQAELLFKARQEWAQQMLKQREEGAREAQKHAEWERQFLEELGPIFKEENNT